MLILFALSEEKVKSKNLMIDEYLFRLGEGDRSAMGGLYELISEDVFAFALSKTCDRELSEDVTHDTFVQLYKNAPLYRSQGKPLSWIFTVEINIIRRLYQQNKRTVSLEDHIESLTDEHDFAESMAKSEFVRDLLATLSEEEREIVVLHVVSGLRHREIASLLEMPLATVLSKYHRALKKLKAIVKEGDA